MLTFRELRKTRSYAAQIPVQEKTHCLAGRSVSHGHPPAVRFLGVCLSFLVETMLLLVQLYQWLSEVQAKGSVISIQHRNPLISWPSLLGCHHALMGLSALLLPFPFHRCYFPLNLCVANSVSAPVSQKPSMHQEVRQEGIQDHSLSRDGLNSCLFA